MSSYYRSWPLRITKDGLWSLLGWKFVSTNARLQYGSKALLGLESCIPENSSKFLENINRVTVCYLCKTGNQFHDCCPWFMMEKIVLTSKLKIRKNWWRKKDCLRGSAKEGKGASVSGYPTSRLWSWIACNLSTAFFSLYKIIIGCPTLSYRKKKEKMGVV